MKISELLLSMFFSLFGIVVGKLMEHKAHIFMSASKASELSFFSCP